MKAAINAASPRRDYKILVIGYLQRGGVATEGHPDKIFQ